jgi:hypothetical protein
MVIVSTPALAVTVATADPEAVPVIPYLASHAVTRAAATAVSVVGVVPDEVLQLLKLPLLL